MIIVEDCSIRNAKNLLEERGALVACRQLAIECEGDPSKNKDLVHCLGFRGKTTIPIGDNRPKLDAYSSKWKVGVEREFQEQMNVRSHLLFTEIGHQLGMIEIGVYILSISNSKANFKRTFNELTEYDIFTKYFPLTVPLYIIGCEYE